MDDTLLCIECCEPVEDCVCVDGPLEYDEDDYADELLDQEREER